MWKFAELGAIPNLPAVDHHVILMVHRNHRRVIVMAGARHLSMMGMGDETVAHGLALVPDEKGRGKETNEAVAGIDRKLPHRPKPKKSAKLFLTEEVFNMWARSKRLPKALAKADLNFKKYGTRNQKRRNNSGNAES